MWNYENCVEMIMICIVIVYLIALYITLAKRKL